MRLLQAPTTPATSRFRSTRALSFAPHHSQLYKNRSIDFQNDLRARREMTRGHPPETYTRVLFLDEADHRSLMLALIARSACLTANNTLTVESPGNEIFRIVQAQAPSIALRRKQLLSLKVEFPKRFTAAGTSSIDCFANPVTCHDRTIWGTKFEFCNPIPGNRGTAKLSLPAENCVKVKKFSWTGTRDQVTG